MKKVFVVRDVVVGTAWALQSAAVSVTPTDDQATVYEVPLSSPVDVGWLMVSNDKGEPEFKAPAPVAPTIGPNEFYFLWTMPEQVAIDELRDSDRVVKLFMRRLDDPRTTEIMLSDPAVQAAVRHTVEQLVAKGVIKATDTENRIATLLAGGRL